LLFLPTYSPDLNPIEESFSAVKAHLRRHGSALRISAFLEDDLLEACVAAVTPVKAASWYAHSGYH
ncbi:hypothetical protein FA95DRAFT_1499054, partial [Auriscalpium vulgare]